METDKKMSKMTQNGVNSIWKSISSENGNSGTIKAATGLSRTT